MERALIVLSAVVALPVFGAITPSPAIEEIERVHATFGTALHSIPRAAGAYTLGAADSLTADLIVGRTLDPYPPQLGPVPTYPISQQDGANPRPYVSSGLQNFRFDFFHNIYNFGGPHTWPSGDYASTHGFSVITNYARQIPSVDWMPAGTQWLAWFTYVDWTSFMSVLGLPAGRWDLVMDLGTDAVVQAVLDANAFASADATNVDELMIDMEHAALDPASLRQQPWYPASDTSAERAAFEKKYYDGFALTQYGPILAARQLGFGKVSLYGWRPARADWFGLETYPADPTNDWFWQNVGVQVLPHVDSVNNSVYCYYWSAQNTAYTLAQNDLNLKYINSLPKNERKPLRPYFWNQLHGGGSGWRWWMGQGLPSEELRAIALLNAFTQYDGMALWNFSGATNLNLPPPLAPGVDVMLKDGLSAQREGGGSRELTRYDALHITDVRASGTVRFQLIEKDNFAHDLGMGPAFPYYLSNVATLTPHLRAPSENLAAMFEGLAMARVLEWNLRHGKKVVERDSQQLYASAAPIVRHIQTGDLHIIATYDPQVVYGRSARDVVLENFSGVAGLNLTFTADASVRVYIICMSD